MGVGSSEEVQSQTQNSASTQKQLIDQNYSNNIMFLALSTLQTICLKLLQKDCRSQKKMFGYYDKSDFSQKSISQLLAQLQTQLILFKHSKIDIEKKFSQGFVFPEKLSCEKTLNLIKTFEKLCNKKNPLVIKFINDFISIINKKYSSLNFESENISIEYSQTEKKAHKSSLLKNGINAGNQMNKLREEVQKKSDTQVKNLQVVLKNPALDYDMLIKGN